MTGTFFASAHSRGLRRHLMKDCDCETDLCLSAFVRVATSVQTIYSNLTELCHSAFVRVATSSSPLTMWTATFATAHSCGLRPIATNYAKSGKRFASAHSRGLRPIPVQQTRQRVSLPQRIRAGCDCTCGGLSIEIRSLPQRIRAGCDSAAVGAALFTSFFATAHSRGLRRCWKPSLTATRFFATAHSRGLRRSKTKSSTTLCCFATAHSRGLRPSWRNNPIPSRLLCHSAFARVATVVYCVCCRYCAIFATAHSRGLRLRKSNAAHCDFAARR